MENNEKIINISKKSFFNVLIILFVLITITGILTRVINQGVYNENGIYNIINENRFPIYKWYISWILVLFSKDGINIIFLSLFLLTTGGFFQIMKETKGLDVLIRRIIKKYSNNKIKIVFILSLFFMLFGSIFGIFEEALVVLPVIIILSLSLGYDNYTALGICLLATGFGFAQAITNPFSIGVASNEIGVSLSNGILFRILTFFIFYLVLIIFLVKHIKKIEKDVNKSNITIDLEEIENEDNIFKLYTLFFILAFVFILLTTFISFLQGTAVVFLILIFLIGSLVCGRVVYKNFKETFKVFIKGSSGALAGVILILMASSIKYMIEQGLVIDTIIYELTNHLKDMNSIVALLFIFLIIIILEFFISSSTAKATLVMAIIGPLVVNIGISKELAVLAFIYGDGVTNIIFPTSPVLLIGLGMAGISYVKWIKWIKYLIVITLVLNILFLIIGYYVGY